MRWITNLLGGPQRVNHAAITIGNKIYSFGGYTSEESFELRLNIDVHELDTDTLRWRRIYYADKKQAPKKCYGHTAVAYGLKAYLWGGRSNLSASNKLYCFDTVSLLWTKIQVTGTIPNKVDGHSACVIGCEMFVFGGYEEEEEVFSNSVYRLNLETFNWEKIKTSGEPPSPRDFHTASVIGDRMYVFGGRSSSEHPNAKDTYNNDIMYLDVKTGMWVKPLCSGKLPCGRRSHSAAVYNNKIYMIGGFDGQTKYHLNDIYCFNPETNEWSEMHPNGDPPCPRRRHCTAVVGDHLFLFGGSSPIDQEEYANHYQGDYDDNYYLQLHDHSDTHILDFSPSLKRLCQLEIIKCKFDTTGLPRGIVQEINMLTAYTSLSQSFFTPYPRTDFLAIGYSA